MRRGVPWLVATLLASVLAVVGPVAGAQDEPTPPPTPAADWVPFTGSHAVGCTLADVDNPGCEVHHPTWAIDLATPANKRIRSTGHGVVVGVRRGCAPLGGDGECNGGAGNMVIVGHGDYWSRYLHLSKIPNRIKEGLVVEPGTVLGRAGASGTFGGAHLHYDEYQLGPPSGRVEFGRMLACHDDQPVVYPDVLGYDAWTDVPRGSMIRNDGYTCSGHPSLPHPPAPQPPVYPEGPPLGIGGSQAVGIADVDADGDMDLVIGSPGANPQGVRRAGAVTVVDPFHKSESGSLTQEHSMAGLLEAGDRVGAAVATGDYDCDGLDDVAIGAPGEDLSEPFDDTGAVNLVYGNGESSLIFAGQGLDSYYRRPSDWVGAALATGDYNGDGCDDLAIASPGADRSAGLDMGLVWTLSGTPDGLVRPTRLLQGINFGGVLESHDQTGYALVAADFNCDGVDDLAAGAPREVIDGAKTGAVMVAYGGPRGFSGGEALFQGTGLPGTVSGGDRTGLALAAGDIDGDGCADLAVGAPGERVDGHNNAGAVLVTFGDEAGLGASERSLELANGAGLAGRPRAGDRLGTAVALADLDCDGFADLVTGAPKRDIGSKKNAGAVFVKSGSAQGLDGPESTLRPGRGLKGRNKAKAKLGSSIVAGDVDLDGCVDLVISAPGTSVADKARAGAVHLAFGAAAHDPMRFDQRSLPGSPTRKGTFGGASPAELLGAALAG